MKNIAQIIMTFCEESNVDVDKLLLATSYDSEKIQQTRYMIYHYLFDTLHVTNILLSKIFSRSARNVMRGRAIIKQRLKNERALREQFLSIVNKIEGGVQ
jgi:hypothetical protein